MKRSKITAHPVLSFLPFLAVIYVWAIYISLNSGWQTVFENWYMSLTMVFGSFIAGASSEGGGAVAFPVMTLLLDIPPAVARNFSLAIQSIGMTMAAYLIFLKRIRIELNYLIPVSIGGGIGMVASTYFLVPIVTAAYAKMLFVTFWLSFGLVLYYVNEIYKRDTVNALPRLSYFEKSTIIFIGIIGGSISALLGSGLDIFSFSYVTMRYHLSEKIATPTSVVIMASNSIIGFVVHSVFLRDFGTEEFNYWLACIPVVVIGAPAGAYLINKQTRNFISRFLYVVILIQFIGALFILKPTGPLLYFSVAVLCFGIFLFFGFAWLSTKYRILR